MAKTLAKATRSVREDIPVGLILKPPAPDEWRLGSGLASERFGGSDINPSGDWTPYKAADEHQAIKFEFDTMACAVFATLKAWAMLAKFHGFGSDFPADMSERYSGVLCGTTQNGTDPHDVGEITRKTAGVIPQASMPWTPDIDEWDEYYDRRMAFRNLDFGRKLLDRFELGHEWIFPWGNDLSPEEKHELLRAALKRGPVCVSVKAWRRDGKRYTKKRGERDGHWVNLVRFDGKYPVIHDQYDPFEKELTELYDFEVAKLYFLKRKTETNRNFWSRIWDYFGSLRGV